MFAGSLRRWRAVLPVCAVFSLMCLAQGQPSAPSAQAIHQAGLPAAPPWYDPGKVSWALWITAGFAVMACFLAGALRRQVNAKTRALQLSLDAQSRARQFDAARNQVLEQIASHAPLTENMEKLALAIESQIDDCCCAIVMPPDGKCFLNGKAAPLLIAPGLPLHLHPEVLRPLADLFSPDVPSDEEPLINDQTLIAQLLGSLWAAGLTFCSGRMVIAFSGEGEAAGIVLLFLKGDSSNPSVTDSILQSSSRLVALAADHARMHERLLHQARHDGLTGLPNRMVAEDRLEQALARAERSRSQFAVLCLDLDGFKKINDQLGHDAGDELLRAVSSRLRGHLRNSDTLARMGGDEFLILLEECTDATGARSVAETLVSALQPSFAINGEQLRVSLSIGVAVFPADGRNAIQLRRNADMAMYRAKNLGGSQVSFWAGEVALKAAAAHS